MLSFLYEPAKRGTLPLLAYRNARPQNGELLL